MKSIDTIDQLLYDSPFPWWEWHIPSNKVTASKHKVEMLGYKHEEFLDLGYQAYTDLLHKDDYDRTMKSMQDLLDGIAKIYQVDYRILAADGTYHWYMDRGMIVKKLDDNSPELVRGIVLNLGSHVKQTAPADQLVALFRKAVTSERTGINLIVLCSNCLRVNAGNEWMEFSNTLSDFISLPQTHYMCKDCLYILYPNIADKVLKRISDENNKTPPDK